MPLKKSLTKSFSIPFKIEKEILGKASCLRTLVFTFEQAVVVQEQCDRIGLLLKRFGYIVFYKIGPEIGQLLCYFKNFSFD